MENDVIDVFHQSTIVNEYRIEELEKEIEKQITARHLIETKLEEASREPGIKNLISSPRSIKTFTSEHKITSIRNIITSTNQHKSDFQQREYFSKWKKIYYLEPTFRATELRPHHKTKYQKHKNYILLSNYSDSSAVQLKTQNQRMAELERKAPTQSKR